MVTSLSTISIQTFWHTASSVPALASKFAGRSETIGFSLDQMNVVYDSVFISIGLWVFDDNKQLGIQNCVLSKRIQFNNIACRSLLLHDQSNTNIETILAWSLDGRCWASNVLHEHVPGAGQHSWVLHSSTLTLLRCCRHVLPFYEQHWTSVNNWIKHKSRHCDIVVSIVTCSHLLINQSLHRKQNWERLRLAQMESRMHCWPDDKVKSGKKPTPTRVWSLQGSSSTSHSCNHCLWGTLLGRQQIIVTSVFPWEFNDTDGVAWLQHASTLSLALWRP